jgi:hypothetical protein
MPKITWDDTGKRIYETGVDHGVLYLSQEDGSFSNGVAWNGLSSVSQSPSGAEASPIWADNIKYLNLVSAEEFSASVEAYTYPDEFAECDGSKLVADGVYAGQQTRKRFGLSYRTQIGNDVKNTDYGYKLHLIYNCLASPSEKSYQTINDSPEAIAFSWEIATTPVTVNKTGVKPTATLEIDSTKVPAEKMAALEAILYGSEEAAARLPLPDEVITLIGEA